MLQLIPGHFHGFGWGLLVRAGDGWSRRLGPDGRAVVLLRVRPTQGFRFRLRGLRSPKTEIDSLRIYVNGENANAINGGCAGEAVWFELAVAKAAVVRAQGCMQILLCEPANAVRARGGSGFGFSELRIRPG